MNSAHYRALVLLVIVSLIFSACQSPASSPKTTPQVIVSTVAPTAQAETPATPVDQEPKVGGASHLVDYLKEGDFAPRVVSEAADMVSATGDITLTFDQAMDTEKTTRALSITDASGQPVSGKISWKGSKTMVFRAEAPLKAGEAYQARVDTGAVNATGEPLARQERFLVHIPGELAVQQVVPANQAVDVENTSTITVMFNRPVVPLVIAEERETLESPIRIEPEVSGHGEWINTSMYVFYPDQLLTGGQSYRVTVPAGLTDATQEDAAALKADYSWLFQVARPALERFEVWEIGHPKDKLKNVPLEPTLELAFRQPMKVEDVRQALHLEWEGGTVPLRVTWNEAQTLAIVRPASRLSLKTEYTFRLDHLAAQAQDGGNLDKSVQWTFTTVPAPSIRGSNIRDGQKNTVTSLTIQFASPMDFDSLAERVVFSPEIDVPTHSYYSEQESTINIYGLEPSTTYTVKILPGMRDPYGNTIQEGREMTFTTRALDPSYDLLMPYLPIYRADTPHVFYLRHVNIDRFNVDLYRLTAEQFIKDMRYEGDYSWQTEENLVWSFEKTSGGAQNEPVIEELSMHEPGKDSLETGFYFLGLDAEPFKTDVPFLDSRVLIVSTENLTLKLSPGSLMGWLTNLESGKPVPGVKLAVYDESFQRVAEGETDQDGLFQVAVDTADPAYSNDKALAHTGWFVMVDQPGHFAFASTDWGGAASPYEFGIEEASRSWVDTVAYVYTERPLYRPGQPVYFKGIVRQDDDLLYSLPEAAEVEVVIGNYRQEVYRETLTLSESGALDGEFQLAAETDLGGYSLSVYSPGGSKMLGATSFNVAEYRRPEFQLDVAVEPANVLPGDAFDVQLDAAYYSGGGLADARLDWTLRSEPFVFNPPAEFGRYAFQDEAYDDWDYIHDRRGNARAETLAQGEGQTGEDGKFSLALEAEPGKEEGSRRLTWEASVTDFSGSTVSGRAGLVMHRSTIYPGIRSTSYVAQVGKEQTFDLVALDWDGQPQPGGTLDVEIVERKWYSVQEEDADGRLTWKTTVEETPVASFSAVPLDDQARASVSFIPEKGGIYRARVTARDAKGNRASASAFVWASGMDFVPWMRTNDRTFQLIADRDSYTPGDTAELLIASPFQGESYALVTIERGRVRESQVLRLENNSTIYKLPVTADMAPNVYIEVLIVKGVDETNPRPAFKVGMARVNVSIEEQTLNVTLTPDREEAGPGETVGYTVETTTQDGQPVEAEVSLALSDLSTLSLMPAIAPPLVEFFYAPRRLSVQSAVSMVNSIEDYNAMIEETLQPEGGKMGSGGGGKGGGYAGVMEVRQDFPDTAYWNASLHTGTDGKAAIEVPLPDNLTIWRLDARAITTDTRVGQSTVDIQSTKTLLIRPQTPRFFVAGDQVQLGAAVHNNSDEDLTVDVALQAGGVELLTSAGQQVEIPSKQQAYLTWEVKIPEETEWVDLVFSAQGGGYEDATRPSFVLPGEQGLPVYRYEVPETVGTSGVLTENGGRAEAIQLPADMPVEQGELNIKVSPSLVAGMTDGLNYLEHYPYECIEQTISRFLPNVRLARALQAVGSTDAALDEELKTQVNVALQKITLAQNSDGGWGWWNGMESDLLVSAYVVLGLVEAEEAGYTVNSQLLDSGLGFVSQGLVKFGERADAYKLNRQAFLLYVLARAGEPDVSKTVKLYGYRQEMALYARSYLMMALHHIDPADERLNTLMSDLNNAAILSATGAHWEEGGTDYLNWNTDTRSTAIALAALIQVDPANPVNPMVVRWLMSNRKQGAWFSTQETAWSLMALTDWVTASGELQPDYEYAVALNDEELATGTASAETVREEQTITLDVTKLLTSEVNRLAFAREGNAGSLYYTAHLKVWLPVNQIPALDQGVVIDRQYFRPEDLSTPVTEAEQGEVLLARLTIVTPGALHYLLVNDPLPAGLEAVDPQLNTSPTPEMPDSYSWEKAGVEGWGWWYFSHAELRDEKVVLSTQYLPAGTYTYTYRVRASTPGEFNLIPPTAEEFYFPEVYGRGAGSTFVVRGQE